MRDRRVDRVLRDVAADAEVVAAGRLAGQGAALALHLVRRLPGAADHLADPSHRLGVRRHHAERAQIVQHVLGGDRLATRARIGERHVLRDARRQMMGHHHHVEHFVDGVPRERHRRIRGGRKDVRLAAQPDDVRRVSASGTLGVIGVNRAPGNRPDRVLDEAGFVQRVGMDRDLDVEFVGDRQALIDGGRCRAPVFVQLPPDGARKDLLSERIGPRSVALAEKSEIERKRLERLVHAADVPRAWRARGGFGAGGRPGAAADQRGDPRVERVGDLVRRDEVHVRIDRPSRQDVALAREHFGGRPDHQLRRHAVHYPRIARFSDT